MPSMLSTGQNAPPLQVPPSPPGTRLAALLAAALCLAAVLLAAVSFAPYEAVLSRLDALASTGSASQSYPPVTHARLVLASRVLAAGLLGLGAVCFLRRAAVARSLAALGADARAAASDLASAVRAPGRARRLEYPVLAALTLLGMALRVIYMQRPPRGDEALMFVQFAQRPLPVIVADYSDVGNHIFHTLLLHVSWLLLGETVWGMRLPDLVTGVALIPLTYAVTRGLYGGPAALVAAAFVAGSSALVDYSVNGRGYCLQTLLLLAAFGVAYLQLRRERATWWAAWSLAAALAMWTVPTSAIALVGIGLWYLANRVRRDGAGAWPGVWRFLAASATAGVLTAVLYAPVLLTSGLGHLIVMMNSGSTDVALAGPLAALAAIWRFWTRNLPAPLGWIGLGLLGVGIAREAADARRGGVPVGVAFALWLVAFYLVSRTIGYARLWLPFAPFAYALVAFGLVACLRRLCAAVPGGTRDAWIAATAPLALLAVLSATELHHRFVARQDGDSFFGAPALTAALPGLARPGERILAVQPYGSILRLHLRAAGVAHHTAPFRASEAEPYQTVLAMGAAGGQRGTLPGTLLVVAPDGREGLARVLHFYGLPDAGESAEVLLRLPDVTLFRIADTSVP